MNQVTLQTSSSGAGGSWSVAWDCSGSPRNYNYKRYYQPGTGRYLSVDPVRDSANYTYARNTPLQLFDPTGEVVPLVVAGAVIGGAINAGLYLATHSSSEFSSREFLGQVGSGLLAGGLGAAAGPLAGSISRSLGMVSNGVLSKLLTTFISGVAGSSGEALNKAIKTGEFCAEQFQSTGKQYIWASLGGLASTLFPIRGILTLRQAAYFSPKSLEAFLRTGNSRRILTSYVAAAGLGSAGPLAQSLTSRFLDNSNKSIMDGYGRTKSEAPGLDFRVFDRELYALPR